MADVLDVDSVEKTDEHEACGSGGKMVNLEEDEAHVAKQLQEENAKAGGFRHYVKIEGGG